MALLDSARMEMRNQGNAVGWWGGRRRQKEIEKPLPIRVLSPTGNFSLMEVWV